jgi:proton-coupled amino acid transporter
MSLQPLLHLRACARSKRQAIADVTLAVFGTICCIYTTFLTLKSWMGPEVPQSPGYCDSH